MTPGAQERGTALGYQTPEDLKLGRLFFEIASMGVDVRAVGLLLVFSAQMAMAGRRGATSAMRTQGSFTMGGRGNR